MDLLRREIVHQFVMGDLALAMIGGLAWFAFATLRPRTAAERPTSRLRLQTTVGVTIALVASLAITTLQLSAGRSGTSEASRRYELTVLDGTIAEGSSTDSPLLRLLLGGAVPKVQTLVRRQEEGERTYRESATARLTEQSAAMTGPREGETAVLMQSDMHCNTTMIRLQVARMLRCRFGGDVPALMAVTGDLTSDVAGIAVLGDGDPSRSELFGDTRLRAEESEGDLGNRLYDQARDDKPQLVLVP